MSVIDVLCVDQVLTFTNMPVIASGDINADKVKFEFDSSWDGYSKICTFYQQKGSYYYGILDENDEVIIPSGAMNKHGCVCFGVSGYKDGVTKTSNVLTYEIVEGAYTEADTEEGKNLVAVIRKNMEEIREEADDALDSFNAVVDNLAYLRLQGDNEFQYADDITSKILTACQNIDAKALRFSIGSYTGNGTYGSSNPNSLTFEFNPKILIVYENGGLTPNYGSSSLTIGWYNSFLWAVNQNYLKIGGIALEHAPITLNNKTLTWYVSASAGNADAAHQCNRSGTTYYYICIGMDGEINVN